MVTCYKAHSPPSREAGRPWLYVAKPTTHHTKIPRASLTFTHERTRHLNASRDPDMGWTQGTYWCPKSLLTEVEPQASPKIYGRCAGVSGNSR